MLTQILTWLLSRLIQILLKLILVLLEVVETLQTTALRHSTFPKLNQTSPRLKPTSLTWIWPQYSWNWFKPIKFEVRLSALPIPVRIRFSHSQAAQTPSILFTIGHYRESTRFRFRDLTFNGNDNVRIKNTPSFVRSPKISDQPSTADARSYATK